MGARRGVLHVPRAPGKRRPEGPRDRDRIAELRKCASFTGESRADPLHGRDPMRLFGQQGREALIGRECSQGGGQRQQGKFCFHVTERACLHQNGCAGRGPPISRAAARIPCIPKSLALAGAPTSQFGSRRRGRLGNTAIVRRRSRIAVATAIFETRRTCRRENALLNRPGHRRLILVS